MSDQLNTRRSATRGANTGNNARETNSGENTNTNSQNNTITLTNQKFQMLIQSVQQSITATTSASRSTPTFAITPSLVDTTTFIDYATSDGKKLYRNAIEALPIKYDLEPGSTNTFNESLKDKCASTGWSDPNADVITVPNSDGKT